MFIVVSFGKFSLGSSKHSCRHQCNW